MSCRRTSGRRRSGGKNAVDVVGPPHVRGVGEQWAFAAETRRRRCARRADRRSIHRTFCRPGPGSACPTCADARRTTRDGSRSSASCALRPTPAARRRRGSAASMRARRSLRSSAMNHCAVARKMTGFLQRQQCGYECSYARDAHQRARRREIVDDAAAARRRCCGRRTVRHRPGTCRPRRPG